MTSRRVGAALGRPAVHGYGRAALPFTALSTRMAQPTHLRPRYLITSAAGLFAVVVVAVLIGGSTWAPAGCSVSCGRSLPVGCLR